MSEIKIQIIGASAVGKSALAQEIVDHLIFCSY